MTINRSTTRLRASRAAAVATLALTACATSALASGHAVARADATAPSSTTQRGSGTLTDPWVPMLSARTTCQSTTLFGNYTPGSGHASPIVSLPAGTWMGVRYIVSGGYSANVLWHGGDKWGFMRRDCIAFS